MDPEFFEFLARPQCWLMIALPWPDHVGPGGLAEACYVLSPSTIPRRTLDAMSDQGGLVLGWVGQYCDQHPHQRLVWFADVTRWLEWERGFTWADVGVDWEQALAELEQLRVLSMYLQISLRAYQHLINTAKVFELHYLDGSSEILTDEERELVRSQLTDKLDVVWPQYIRDMIARGQIS